MDRTDIDVLQELRKRIFLTSYKRGTTHLASAYSCLEIMYVLYAKNVIRINKDDLSQIDRDRLILSKGHAAIGLYAILEYVGLLEENELDTFLTPHTRLAGEPCKRDLPILEASTGSLGHGLPIGVGMALAQKMDKCGAHTFVILGDGECQEGSVWEAAMSATAYKLNNLTAILDCNRLQKMGFVETVMSHTAWREKWEAFGWQVTDVNGHDVDALYAELSQENISERPRLIIAHTVKGKGVPTMENNVEWHYKTPTRKELKNIAVELGIDLEELDHAGSLH